MNEPIRTQWEIRCAFNGFCKQTLKHEAMNAHRDTKRQQSREVTFSDLSPQEENQLYTYDKYFADDEAEQSFFIAGKEITVKLRQFRNMYFRVHHGIFGRTGRLSVRRSSATQFSLLPGRPLLRL